MPYSGVPEEKTGAMERCVSDVMAKGKDKSSAIAICKTSIMGNAMLSLEAATEQDILSLQAELGDKLDLFAAKGSLPTNAILKFEGACLARAEVNLNNDGINTDGIKQLADTIRLMPLTYEHEKEPRGVFTRGYTDEDSTECLVDGFLWAGHWPKFAEEVRSGQRKLSIDAEADLAVCSICGAAFQTVGEYCEHMRAKNPEAVRWLFDLRSVAGGAVLHPAGTGTVFPGKEGMVIISHKQDLDEPHHVTAEWWRKHWSKESEIPDSAFADKKNRKYPFKNPDGSINAEGWMAAWRYAHKYNASGVIAVLKKHLPKGYKMQNGNVVKVSGGNKMEILCPECGHSHEVTTEAERLQAELDEAMAKLEAKESETNELQARVDSLQAELDAESTVTARFVDLASTVSVEVAQAALPSLRKVDEETFGILKLMASKVNKELEPPEPTPEPTPEPAPVAPPQTMVAAGDSPPDEDETVWTVEI